jgi:tetratricopeptide (TPR) repeat protein
VPPAWPILPDAESGPLAKSLGIASLELRAGVLIQQGKLEPAKKLYEEAAKEEKALGYREPPAYIRPVHETEAVALVKAKDYAGARTAYEAALAERPESGFELYGVAYAKELSGDRDGARAGYQALLKAWPAADSGLPEMVHARQVLGDAAVASK